MSVRKTKSGSWLVDVQLTLPDGSKSKQIRKKGLRSRKEAEEYERRLRDSLLNGTYGRSAGLTFAEFSERFMEDYAINEKENKRSEILGKESRLRNHLLPFFGSMLVRDITMNTIKAFRQVQKKTVVVRGGKPCKNKNGEPKFLAPLTIGRHLILLRTMLNQAEEWGEIDKAPKIPGSNKRKTIPKFYSFDDAKLLLDGALTYRPLKKKGISWQVPALHWWSMIAFALNTGLRQGETLALRVEDVDFVARQVIVRRSLFQGAEGTPKSGHARAVDLNQVAMRALQEQLPFSGRFFWCRPEGTAHSPGELGTVLGRICRRAGLPVLGWHALRHTFASHLAMRGVSIPAIKELLGHASIETTMMYAHLSPSYRQQAVAALDGNSTLTALSACAKTRTLVSG